MKLLLLLFVLILVMTGQVLVGQNIIISEFMAINESFLQDEDGDFSDWIEIYNAGDASVNLKDWTLTDDRKMLSKWVFPDINIEANAYLLVFASGKNKAENELHTNFKLSGSGEFLALLKPNATALAFAYEPAYPVQYANVSYGTLNGGNMYFAAATPGTENVGSLFLAPPIFSVQHGYCNEAFSLELINSSDKLAIYYTTDASTPSNTNGTLYTQAITISTTTIVRAVAYSSTNGFSPTVTASYIFANDVKKQSNNQAGYPSTWLSPIHGSDDYDRIPANYDMKADILSNDAVSSNLEAALKSLPVISLVTDIDNLFSESTDPDLGGIYTYNGEPDGPTKDLKYHLGRGWKRAASIEYFNSNDADKNIDFQANCAIKMHGGATRTRKKTEKHSFKIGFSSSYGPSKLDAKVFGKGSPKQYDWLVLRGGFAPRLGLQVKDPWAKQTIRDMGQYAAYNKFVHVYINGLYWGMYNLSERMDENCMRDNLGGSSSDYDIVKDYYEVETGDATAWDNLVAYAQDDIEDAENFQYLIGNNSDGTPNASFNKMLNADNLMDYMLMNLYAGTGDWDHHNWAAARRKTNSEGFHFLTWDAEGVFSDVSVSDIINKSNENRPTGVFADLLANEQFQNLFISFVNKHFFEEGALTPKACLARYEQILGNIDTALIADQARWVYDEKDIWNTKYHDFIYDYFPKRTEVVFRQFVTNGLYPAIDFPKFSTSNNSIPDTMAVFLSAVEGGEVLYTLDGTDPGHVLQTNAESIHVYDNKALPLVLGVNNINVRVKQDSLWSRLVSKKFTVKNTNTTSTHDLVAQNTNWQSYPNPITDELHFAFTLNEAANVSIRIYTLYGTELAVITNDEKMSGEHNMVWNTETLSAGIYVVVFENRTKGIVSKVKMIKQ